MYGGHLFAQPSTSYCREPAFPALPSSPKNKRIRGPLRDPQPRPGPVLAPNANLEPFWEYLRDVIFRKLEDPHDNKAHISSIIQAMKGDQALLYGYGDILEYVLNKINMILFRFVDFHEFRSMVSAPQASSQLTKPSPARLTARQESGENEGGVVTRIMHQKTQEYLQRLARISDDYKVPDSDLQKVADQEASALDTFGMPGDALKQAIDQCSALVEERAQERREKGVEDSRDLVDRVHKRMTGGDVDDLIRKRMGTYTMLHSSLLHVICVYAPCSHMVLTLCPSPCGHVCSPVDPSPRGGGTGDLQGEQPAGGAGEQVQCGHDEGQVEESAGRRLAERRGESRAKPGDRKIALVLRAPI